MKTKLLILLLIAFSSGNAQINLNEGFESGTIPSGWVNTNFSFNNTNSCSGAYSAYFTTFGLGSAAEIVTPTYTSTGASITVSADYKHSSGSGSFNGIFYLQYYNFTTSNWTTITTATTFTNTCQTLSAIIPSGTIPTGVDVAFKFYLYSTTAGSYTFRLDNTKVFQDFPEAPITEYNFDNSYTNVNGNTPFIGTPGSSFVNNRVGESQKALRVNSSSSFVCSATITNLPTGNSSRTVSLWYKNDSFSSGTPAIFVYGANSNNQYFGNYINTTGNVVLWSNATDHNFGGSYLPNIWRHLVMTHDGANVKLYIDGNYVGQKTTTLNTGNAIGFRIGNTIGAVEYDDLKIYDYALSQAQVSSLYTNNTLSSSDFTQNNLEVALYPNPVRDILNIETTLEVQSVEIYNIQGQKVLSSNQKQINVSDLAAGMYMVRIQDAENNIATKKIVIK
jgi:hypothetical protein